MSGKYKTYKKNGLIQLAIVLIISIFVTIPVSAAAPQKVWERTIPGIINESSPMPIQVDGGNQDVIFGSWNKNVYVLKGENGLNATGWPRVTNDEIDSSPSSGDVDSNGTPEIFIGTGIADIKCSGGGLYSFWFDGAKRFSVDAPDNVAAVGEQCQDPAIHASPALGDVNRDGIADITVGALGLKTWSFNAMNGSTNFGWSYYWDDTQYASPALVDVTGDGQVDIIAPGDSSPGLPVDWQGGMVRALSGLGQPIWEYKTNEIIRSSPSVGDVTGDGDVDIVFGTGNYWAHNGGASDSTKIFVLNRSGQLKCSKDLGAQAMASPTLADFNGDGRLDIAVGTWQTSSFSNDGKVWLIDGATCNTMPNFPVVSGGFLVLGQIITVDLDADGAQDLIVPTANGVHAFNGKTGVKQWVINQGIASYKNAPLITDVDSNGRLDLIIAGTKGDGVTGLVERYEFPVADPAQYGTKGWHMFRFNQQLTGSVVNVPIKDAPTGEKGKGYWMVASDGGVFPFGSAKGFGSTGNINLWKPIVGMASTKSGNGYWLVASDGGIFPFGDAKGFGSTGNIALRKPIVGMEPTPSGNGYWLVASDGGIFPFGDAKGFGSTGNIALRKPIVGMSVSPSGNGYWLGASDGGIFPFGDAVGYGSAGNLNLAAAMVDMTSSPDGGYYFVAGDGGVFTYNAKYYGSTGGLPLYKPVIGTSMVGY